MSIQIDSYARLDAFSAAELLKAPLRTTAQAAPLPDARPLPENVLHAEAGSDSGQALLASRGVRPDVSLARRLPIGRDKFDASTFRRTYSLARLRGVHAAYQHTFWDHRMPACADALVV